MDADLPAAPGGGGGGGVVAEALVNAHMSELTQSSGTTRTKEVDRVIRRWVGSGDGSGDVVDLVDEGG
jgi:hypothetical protein